MESRQNIAQRLLAQGNKIYYKGVLLFYSQIDPSIKPKKPTIIVSVPKKNIKLATNRTSVKRKLRGILSSKINKKSLFHHEWMWIYKTNISNIDEVKDYFNKKLDELFNQESNN